MGSPITGDELQRLADAAFETFQAHAQEPERWRFVVTAVLELHGKLASSTSDAPPTVG